MTKVSTKECAGRGDRTRGRLHAKLTRFRSSYRAQYSAHGKGRNSSLIYSGAICPFTHANMNWKNCAMKEFCCCLDFSLYTSLTLPPKRHWESWGIFLRQSLDSSVRFLEVSITASFLICVSLAAISTDKPTEWRIELARA